MSIVLDFYITTWEYLNRFSMYFVNLLPIPVGYENIGILLGDLLSPCIAVFMIKLSSIYIRNP